jgi:hypothetical protein
MKSLSLNKVIYLLTAITLLPLLAHCQYKKDIKAADDAYRTCAFFDAIELYKKTYTDIKDDQKDGYQNVLKASCICRIADCYRQMCDFMQVEQWYAKAKKCRCIDSNIANQYLAEADRILHTKDTTIKFVKYYDCDDCNEGHWVPFGNNNTAKSLKDTCKLSLPISRAGKKDTVMHLDTASLVRNSTCIYMLDLPNCGKEVRYLLFKGDASGNKINFLYERDVDKNMRGYDGMDITYLPAGIYLFYAYCDDSRQKYFVHLK